MLFFFYDNLKVGHINHSFIKGERYMGSYTTSPLYTMYDMAGIYPAVVMGGNTSITGEIYDVQNVRTIQNIYALYGNVGVVGDVKNYFDSISIVTPFGNAKMFLIKNHIKRKTISDGKWR